MRRRMLPVSSGPSYTSDGPWPGRSNRVRVPSARQRRNDASRSPKAPCPSVYVKAPVPRIVEHLRRLHVRAGAAQSRCRHRAPVWPRSCASLLLYKARHEGADDEAIAAAATSTPIMRTASPALRVHRLMRSSTCTRDLTMARSIRRRHCCVLATAKLAFPAPVNAAILAPLVIAHLGTFDDRATDLSPINRRMVRRRWNPHQLHAIA